MKIDYEMKLPKASLKKTGKKIRELREERKITQDDICILLDLAERHSVYAWEKGVNYPNMNHLVGLARIFDVKLDNIIQLEESEDE